MGEEYSANYDRALTLFNRATAMTNEEVQIAVSRTMVLNLSVPFSIRQGV